MEWPIIEDDGWEDGSVDALADYEKEQVEYAIALSLSEKDFDDEQLLKDTERASIAQLEEDKKRFAAQLEEEELLAKELQESLNVVSLLTSSDANLFQPDSVSSSSESRICSGCCREIGDGQFLDCIDGVWHPECFRCQKCSLQITDDEFSVSGDHPYHKSCYKKQHHPRCYVCNNYLPVNEAHHADYSAHPFWMQKFCPSHERDGTPICCSCERRKPRDTTYLSLDDGRNLCLECLDSAIMDTHECQPLYHELREFFEGLNMKVSPQIPLLLVDRQALNEAKEGEQNGSHHMFETNGLTLFEEGTVRAITRSPRIGASNPFIGLRTEPHKLAPVCEVTAVLILHGLPRLLTGSILAHELMHTWLRLSGYRHLSPEVEEGICQVMAHLWLDSKIHLNSTGDIPSSSSRSSTSRMQQGKWSGFDKQLGEFYKHQIESDLSLAYGEGFREGSKAVKKYGLKQTLEHIKLTGSFPL